MEIKAVGFDFGGVISTHKSVMPEIAAITQVPLDDIKKVYFENNKLANLGSMSYEELWTIILEKFSKQEYLQEVIKHLKNNAKADINEAVLDLVDELKAKGLKVGLLSNNTIENGNLMRE